MVQHISSGTPFEAVAEAVGPVFADIRPAATMVIATMIEDAMKIDIEVTARIGVHTS